MTVEYLPVGVACNISCKYCYQDPMRDAGNVSVARDWRKAKETIKRIGSDFSVFGGEPLLAPLSHLQEVFDYGYTNFGKNGIQTNGSLITDDHISLFLAYNVQVGISIDGPGEMNSVRCANDLTAKTERAIRKLCDLNRPPSLIVTIHRGNNDLPALCNWLDDLVKMGVRYINFHELEVECGKDHLSLSEDRNIETFLYLYEWYLNSGASVMPFSDIYALLTQEYPRVTCTWNQCDPLTTPAVQGVSAQGVMSNCGRTNKDGVNWVKGDHPGIERYVALYHTPQEHGGCQGCRYFAFCSGHCPGTAIDGDWRNRTVNCRLWYALFERIERDNQVSLLTRDQVYQKELKRINAQEHGDGHGDVPHGDSHGDHNDGIEATILERSPL